MKQFSLERRRYALKQTHNQTLMTMKITLFLLLFVSFQAFCTTGYSQSAHVKVSTNTLSISELLSQIEKQTDYLFVYNKKNLDLGRIVNIQSEAGNVANVLKEAFDGTGITFIMEGKNIVLTKESQPAATQQERITIKGIVTDQAGEPIIGANILEQGTVNGTITDLDGNFTLDCAANAVLIVSYIGYKSEQIPVNRKRDFTIKLIDESLTLDNVVVTALGILKKEASLTYSTQQISGDELNRAKDPNMITALAGKTAGVQINKSSSGLGGSAKVSIRGSRSIYEGGNNQPLYVIDGVPILNSISEQASTAIGGTDDAGNRDGGDGISNLNPDDIESMSILKGATAAALYGSQAANGVILITTKKGKAGIQRVSFSSNLTVDHAINLPEFQNSYGRKDTQSWGDAGNLTDYDNAGKFFQNGVTAINSLSFTNGGEKMQTYFSYANTSVKGIVEKSEMTKHNLNFRETASFFNDRLNLDANVNLMMQTIKNKPTSGGYYMNPLVGLYGFPRGQDMQSYRDDFELYDVKRNLPLQNWYAPAQDFEQNPYWITNRIKSNDNRARALVSLTANVKVTDWLSFQARGNADYTSDKYYQKMYASTAPSISGPDGRYIDMNRQELLVYGDIMAMFNKKWNDISLNGAVGGSINKTTINSIRLDSKTASLYKPNLFSVANIMMNSSAAITEDRNRRRTVQSAFATAQLGWKESLYLDVTARNEWSSTLAFTDSKNSGYFYPSIGASWVINNTVKLPQWISMGKVRASWAQVGNDIPLYVSNPVDLVGAGNKNIMNDTEAFDKLKPELTKAIEFGTEWKFFDYRLHVDFTYYRSNTTNQLLRMNSPTGAKLKYYYVNAGNVQNEGMEITLGGTPIMSKDFRWKTEANFSTNKNKVKELHKDLSSFAYGDEGFSAGYMMRMVEGGSMGDIYGNVFDRDDSGNILYENNLPMVKQGNNDKVGNSNPDFLLGWSNTLIYKGLSFYFLIDMRVGGDVLSMTQAELDKRGVSKESGDARKRGYVELEGKQIKDVEGFYSRIGGRSCATEYYIYDATNIRLREVSLGYTFPRKMVEKTKVFSDIQLSLIARNLFFFHKKAPFDPDAVLATGNTNQGIDVFGMPTTRSMGFNIKLTF